MDIDDLVVGIMVIDVTRIRSFCDKFLELLFCGSTVRAYKFNDENARSGSIYFNVSHGD